MKKKVKKYIKKIKDKIKKPLCRLDRFMSRIFDEDRPFFGQELVISAFIPFIIAFGIAFVFLLGVGTFILCIPFLFVALVFINISTFVYAFVSFSIAGSPEFYKIIHVNKKYDYFESIRIDQRSNKKSFFILKQNNQQSVLLEDQLFLGEWCHIKYTNKPKYDLRLDTILEVYSCKPSKKDYRTEIKEKIEDIFKDSESENEYHKRVRKLKEFYGLYKG